MFSKKFSKKSFSTVVFMVIAALVLGLTGCGESEKETQKQRLAIQARMVVRAQSQIKNITEHPMFKVNISARGNNGRGICGAYQRYREMENLADELKDSQNSNLERVLSQGLESLAGDFVNSGYAIILGGGSMPSCGSVLNPEPTKTEIFDSVSSSEMTAAVLGAIDRYVANDHSGYNWGVVRSAYIKAVKAELPAEMAEYKKDVALKNEEAGLNILALLKEAAKFNILPADLGVDPVLVSKLRGEQTDQ